MFRALIPALTFLVGVGMVLIAPIVQAQDFHCSPLDDPQGAFTCVPEPTSTPTLVPLPTPTLPALPTAVLPTAVPTSNVQPTITPTPQPPVVAMIDGIPVCDDDDVTWHGTVERNVDGSIRCTYGHEHGDNPHALDGTFGPMGVWWNSGLEHDISYPWETLHENEAKHTAYKIIVRGSDSVPLTPYSHAGATNYVKALRGTYHADGAKGFAMSEYHSFDIEVQVCSAADNNCGILRMGGVQDLGERLLTHNNGTYTCVFPNPNIKPDQGICGNGHDIYGPVTMAGGPGDSRQDETWYGSNIFNHQAGPPYTPNVTLAFGVILGSGWSPIHAAMPMDAGSSDPAARGDYANHGYNSARTLDAVGIFPSGFPVNDAGRINFKGFTDRYGNVVQGCTGMGSDCVPIELTNMPMGYAGFGDPEYVLSTGLPSLVRDNNVINPATGHPLLVWPN